jgi:hypothetical protein
MSEAGELSAAYRGVEAYERSRLTIEVPVDLHTRIKVECARRRAKMTDVIRELLEQEFPKPQQPHEVNGEAAA